MQVTPAQVPTPPPPSQETILHQIRPQIRSETVTRTIQSSQQTQDLVVAMQPIQSLTTTQPAPLTSPGEVTMTQVVRALQPTPPPQEVLVQQVQPAQLQASPARSLQPSPSPQSTMHTLPSPNSRPVYSPTPHGVLQIQLSPGRSLQPSPQPQELLGRNSQASPAPHDATFTHRTTPIPAEMLTQQNIQNQLTQRQPTPTPIQRVKASTPTSQGLDTQIAQVSTSSEALQTQADMVQVKEEPMETDAKEERKPAEPMQNFTAVLKNTTKGIKA